MPVQIVRPQSQSVNQRESIDIGLVNNMPDSALASTERQFLSVIEAAADDIKVRMKFYTLPEVPRSESGRLHVSCYSDLDDLWNDPPDALIVTGTEPCAGILTDEPYWNSLTHLVEWAQHNTISCIWSCLAAHAAVLYMDGIKRHRLEEKRSGVFECTWAAEHDLSVGLPERVWMPHSRWNDLPEQQLTSSGYCVLMRSSAGVDLFVKGWNSLYLFFQGHPEYESETLLLEYRRDIRRFLRRETETYPGTPRGYFDDETQEVLAGIRKQAFLHRSEELIASFPTVSTPQNTWRGAAERVYRNWLKYLAGHKKQKLQRLVAAGSAQ